MLDFTCPSCNHCESLDIPALVNVRTNPELKESIMDGSFFLHECPACGASVLLKFPFSYVDPDKRFLVRLSGEETRLSLDDDFVGRRVVEVGDLLEKVRILDAELDDIAVELVKYVTSNDMNIHTRLWFSKQDPVDGNLTFAYAADGELKALSVGAGVYESCCGIVARTPEFKEKSTGLALVDDRWIDSFMR